ncbi:Utp30p [Sugiyamaella lignohabitans]|uniref:Utp30p n=1 Tax=Sugiyamaella lignohabitans TaxID=796027 RepID=A0A161HJA1_9ASCO|nr:Utp30p [Sugiyamaella lignohabitans]ANB11448.1 Utp30p [Sugiyamaella lignohabitans]
MTMTDKVVTPPKRLTAQAVSGLLSKHPNSPVYLQITVKKNPGKGKPLEGNKRVSSPVLISLPHRAREKKLNDMTICLIVKDPQQKFQKVLEDDKNSPTHDLFTEIVSISKLRSRVAASKPSSNSKKAQISIEKFDLIVAQANIIHLLPDTIPASLYKTGKTVPVPIQITAKDPKLPKGSQEVIDPRLVLYQMKKLVNKSTVLVIPKQGSTCFSVLVGISDPDTMSKLIDNINTAIDGIVGNVDAVGGWSNVVSIHIKTADSISLPVVDL